MRFYKTDAAASKSSLQSALSENDSLRARLKSQSAAVSDTDRKVSRVHAFEPTVRHSEPISQPIAYSQSHTAAPDIGIRSSQQRTTNYYSDAPPLHPATRQQISSRTAGQRLSSMSDSEAFVRKSTQNRRHQPVRAYPYDDFTLRKQPASTDRNDLPRRDTFVDKVRARSSSYRYNEAMSIGSDVDTVSSSAYGYDERAAVLNTRPIERSRRHDNSNISVSSAGNTSLKYDRLKSMYKRVTGKDMSRLEYAHQYPGSDDD